MESKDRQESWAQTNSLLLLGIVDLLEEKRIFQECYRVLRPDGRLAVQTSFFTGRHTAEDDRRHPDYLPIGPRNYLEPTLDCLKAVGFRQIESEWVKESVAFYSERYPTAAAWFRDRKYGSYMVTAKKSEHS
ncbi:MAG: class I SAM-dependent methyltransferase [Gemmatimonadetes bacterium]|nr:class I SAM-dependent methyltransferase [Gemmatimonadota bacterium]MYB60107.1 class I SAM-dependent methyltransferase [Gemmatimonadota bacterium]